jgi:hypothetical protein
MKQAFLTSLFALISFSVFANTDAPTSSADQQIADLQKQLEIAKLKAEIAKASATPPVGKEVCVLNRENDVAHVEHISVAVGEYGSLSLDFRFDPQNLATSAGLTKCL